MPSYRLNRFSIGLSVLSLILAMSAVSFGKTHDDPAFSNIRIKNFGRMDDRFYRGAQPKTEDFAALASLGIKTVIDLRDDSQDYEKSAVEAAGMRYVNIPMDDKSYPKPEAIQAFLKLVETSLGPGVNWPGPGFSMR